MNQGRIWCVVSPNVGLPLLLGSVAATSLIVHACVMTQTTWMSNYWQGRAPRTADNGGAAPVAAATPQGSPAFAVTVAPVPGTPGKTETAFVVTVTPNPGVNVSAQSAVGDPVPRGGGGTLALAAPIEK